MGRDEIRDAEAGASTLAGCDTAFSPIVLGLSKPV